MNLPVATTRAGPSAVRRSRAHAQRTRVCVMDAALSVFAKVGVRAATLEDVAALAGVTRGAVYWHFADKAALVSEVVAGLQWPLDIGSDVAGYEAHQQPLRLLHQQLSLQLARCMADPVQWRTIQLVLCHGLRADLPADAMVQIERAMIRAARHVAQVMAIARECRAKKIPSR